MRIFRRCRCARLAGRASHAAGQLFQRIREVRGINYGDYAYIEAFPARHVPVLSRARTSRRQRQIFEIWIRPVVPVNAHMSLRIAIHELEQLVEQGLTPGAVRGDARLPDEQRLRHDGAAGSAARLRARLADGTASASSRPSCDGRCSA